MAVHFEKLKNIITPKTKLNISNVFLSPEVGFKIIHNCVTKELRVTIIGARHLPSLYGLNSVHGYVIKVKIFPGKMKYETQMRKESWPVYNEEFLFHLDSASVNADEQISGKFLVLTAYAILENQDSSKDTKDQSVEIKNDTFKRKYQRKISKLLEYNKTDNSSTVQQPSKNGNQPSKRLDNKAKQIDNPMTFEKRRTIGSVTYSIQFNQFDKQSNFSRTTGEIWKNLQDLNSSPGGASPEGLKTLNPSVRKGDIEVGLLYIKSEDGEKCLFTLSLLRMRCSLQIMQQHEQLNGYLYIKLRIIKDGQITEKGKTEQFTPSISHKFDPKSSNIKATIPIINLENISFQIILMSKTRHGKKTDLGQILLTSKSKSTYLKQWEEALEHPNEVITMWQKLE
ncbi:uncharacterized protein LOC123290871 [Chrysoperla carnea]|uniref:uncharacterized protein LOC123290871 n=1 Tax=Chrysoperla carnea TaxID=189513 RepID=UPI001D06CC32|nr:uncharacterized protein LOC123290871 [Chrysoperla carnea]